MKLTAKLVSILIAAIAVVLVVDGIWAVQREVALFRADMQRDAHLLGSALKGPIEDVWRSGDEEQALQIVQDASQHGDHVGIRWVWLDGSHDARFRPGVSLDRLSDARRGKEISLAPRAGDGGEFLYTYVPMATPGREKGALEIRESSALLDDYVRGTVMRIAAVVAWSAVVSGVAVVVLGVWLVGRPLDQLSEKARRIGGGDLNRPLAWRRRDELGELARAVDTMCQQLAESQVNVQAENEQKLALLEQLRHADRLRTVGQLATGVAHELGTPLNTIAIHSGMIAGGETSRDETAESANVIRDQCGRMTEIIQQLLDYARRGSAKKQRENLRDVVMATIGMLGRFCEKHGTHLRWYADGDSAFAAIDAGQIEQVLTNLIVNAVQAMPGGGDVHIELDRCLARPPAAEDEAEREFACIRVRDEGTGILDADLKHIFDPFFTTKDVGQGTGLGLSIAHGVVQEHGGWIDVQSAPGQGSCFTVFLPASADVVPTAESCTSCNSVQRMAGQA